MLFVSFYSLVIIFDFGFSATISRYVSYVLSGATLQQLQNGFYENVWLENGGGIDYKAAPVMLSGAYLQRAGVFSLQQPMPPGIKPPQHCASPESFRLIADSTTVFLFRNPSRLHSVLRIPQNIIRLQPLHFSYEKGRRVSPLRPGPGANCHYGSLTPA